MQNADLHQAWAYSVAVNAHAMSRPQMQEATRTQRRSKSGRRLKRIGTVTALYQSSPGSWRLAALRSGQLSRQIWKLKPGNKRQKTLPHGSQS